MPTKNDKSNGFTLIELLTVIAVSMVLASLALPIYGNIESATALNDTERLLTQMLRSAESRSLSGKGASDHGLYFYSAGEDDERLVLFSGDSYATRNVSEDEELRIAKSATISTDFPDNEIVFGKNSSIPAQSGTISISSKTINRTINLEINRLGIVNRQK